MSRAVEFSIIIPTYNRLQFLKEAIASVQAQNHSSYEIIVVDDGSTDGTSNYLASLGGSLKTLHQANKGPGSARNLGIRDAVGAYVTFLDSDDLWFPWTLATFHDVIRRHQEPSLISAATVEFKNKVPSLKKDRLVAESFVDYFETAGNPAYVGSGAMAVKRSLLDRTGGFDEKMLVGEDLDLYFCLGTSPGFVRVMSPVTLAYRRHTSNISTVTTTLYSAAIELLNREAKGYYPGGDKRKKERWTLLTRMSRPVTLACLKDGFRVQAWHLYKQSFLMNARLGRFRFLTIFPLYHICTLFKFNHIGRDLEGSSFGRSRRKTNAS